MSKYVKQCSVDGCEKTNIAARGLCHMHYRRALRHNGDISDPDYPNKGKECSIKGCDNPAKGRGLCHTHNTRLRNHGNPHHVDRIKKLDKNLECIIKGCDEPIRSSSMLCHKHYHNMMYHVRKGNIEDNVYEYVKFREEEDKRPTECILKNCHDKIAIRSLCHRHYHNFLYHVRQENIPDKVDAFIQYKEDHE